jgi:outer membrane lipoprotein-sorting protein
MMNTRHLRAGILFVCTLLAGGLPARAADTNAVLNGWLAAQTNFSTWSADFVQTRWLKVLNQPLVSTGHVWFARPNHFRWELGDPAQTIAVRDATQLQVIYPRLKRVERYPLTGAKAGPLGEALGLLDAGFPKDRADFDARFRLLTLQSTNDAWRLALQPANAFARRVMPVIQVTLSKTNFALLANEMQFPDGSRMRNDFRHATLNAAFPAGLFQPALPADFTVVNPLSP